MQVAAVRRCGRACQVFAQARLVEVSVTTRDRERRGLTTAELQPLDRFLGDEPAAIMTLGLESWCSW
jgi:hypothetical protein